MSTAVVVFPGTNCERDVVHALRSLGGDADLVWHRETDLSAFDGVVLPGGFAGFQVLCEAGLLPGALIANRDLAFICRFVDLEVVDNESILTRTAEVGQRIRIPLNSYEGNWVDPGKIGRIVLRYVDDPNGSQQGAAAEANDRGNVVGVMPHPERGVDELLGSVDGRILLEGFLHSLVPA